MRKKTVQHKKKKREIEMQRASERNSHTHARTRKCSRTHIHTHKHSHSRRGNGCTVFFFGKQNKMNFIYFFFCSVLCALLPAGLPFPVDSLLQMGPPRRTFCALFVFTTKPEIEAIRKNNNDPSRIHGVWRSVLLGNLDIRQRYFDKSPVYR